jgi:bacterioferritin-associated ferredoxin
MAVDRCICCDITFERALGLARAHRIGTVGVLQRVLPIGTGCGRCIPYMQRALMSGVTDLPVLDEPEQARLLERAGVRLLGEDQ